MHRQTRTALTVAAALALGACAADDPNRRAKQGALIGAIGGAVAGSAIGDTEGAIIGGAVGAIAGGAVGNYMDKQQRELERELAAERAREELSIQRLSGNALKIGVASDVSFDIDSASLKPNARATFTRIAEVLADYDASIIHVVGHTDSTGAADYNQALSERRASSVVNHLIAQGVNPQRLRQEGRGESEPIASNDTAEGRTRNRRVDVVIKPVVEGRENEAATPPPYLGR
jgi:outer membrane protein OmpA-like peptidoglycan-associated protein